MKPIRIIIIYQFMKEMKLLKENKKIINYKLLIISL